MKGAILVRPIEAKLTHNTDLFTKMDPYCKATVGDQKSRSKVCKSGGKEPKWNETFIFLKNTEISMFIEIKDKSIFKNDIIGSCYVKLNDLVAYKPDVKWYPLSYKGKPAGEVLLDITFNPGYILPGSDERCGAVSNKYKSAPSVVLSYVPSLTQI